MKMNNLNQYELPVRPKTVTVEDGKDTTLSRILAVLSCFFLLACLMSCAVSGILQKDKITSLRKNIAELNLEIVELKSIVNGYEKDLDDSREMLYSVISRLENKDTMKVKVTGYHPNSMGINSDSNPNITATMTPHKAGYTCAISTKLVSLGWLGKEIYIDGFGMVLANDRLAPGIKGMQIDLCKGSYKDAMAVGQNFDVLATLVSRDFIKQKLGDK